MNTDPTTIPLRDLHMPDPISWWPIAPGWWIIVGLVTLVILLFYGLRYLIRKGQLKKQALRELARLEQGYHSGDRNSQQLVQALSILLRRLVMSLYPRQETASLTGESWLAQLDAELINTSQAAAFTQGVGRALIEAPYNPNYSTEVPALIELVQFWISQATKQGSPQ